MITKTTFRDFTIIRAFFSGLDRYAHFSLDSAAEPKNRIARAIMASACCVLISALSGGVALADDQWPPAVDSGDPTTKANDGRAIERFIHGPRDAWGYPAESAGEWGKPVAQETGTTGQNRNSFYVVSPKTPRENAPLCVVLHSANRTAYDYLGFACLGRTMGSKGAVETVMTNSPDDFYSLYLNTTNSEWWGWSQVKANAKKANVPAPAELRVLDTIEWVAQRYKIDRNRIYLCGVSMGGCGTLGIGLPHGDIFAAIQVTVPAGTGYGSYRMGDFAPAPAMDAPQSDRDAWMKRAAAVGLPDPPVIVDFSSQADSWSTTQPALVQTAQAGRLALVLGWGRFGHATFGYEIAKFPQCQLALAFPWQEIRKNEAYPAFTRASCDQRSPWLNAPAEYDDAGQMNALFRWKNQQDTPSDFTIDLWIAHPTVENPPGMPKSATSDVTLRRLQQFKIQPGQPYDWKWVRDGKTLTSGRVTPDASNLLTIPQLALSTEPGQLSLKPAK